MPLTIYRRGDIWHYRGTVAGRRLRGSTGTAVKETAQRIAAETEAEAWKGHLDGPAAILTFSQAAGLYLAAQKPDRFIPELVSYWKDTPVKSINSGSVRQAAIVLYPKAKASTRNRHVIAPTQAIINHCASMDLCNHLKVPRFSVDKKEKTPATWEWVQAFMANANPHLGALCCFMFLTGARISEALSVLWEDIDFTTGKALIRQTKVGSERKAHMPAVLVAAIANIQSNRESGEKVFKYSTLHTAKPQWRKVIKRAKIKPLTYHACRHGFATSMLHNGVDPITVAKLGGWKSAQHVFATYGHAMSDETLADRIVGTPATQTKLAIVENKAKSNG
ncbi:integrase [Ensifer adhaerens]|uniref:Site-specific integrase n=1 Tax=Ensifer adhaerens TaxID=106592 RepID=A0ABY8HE92_ENSAD|nr:site-specific integrase [Ensifer adhaerens]ANK73773.1 integrase [Ensifer adhaerens]KDP70263.1 integrase [Ensifer adhaerens]WFP89860.1 site-specific integrase [Ensifer adhaerens]